VCRTVCRHVRAHILIRYNFRHLQRIFQVGLGAIESCKFSVGVTKSRRPERPKCNRQERDKPSMTEDPEPTAEPTPIFVSAHPDGSPPDLRFVHYNDVYHLDPSSAEPQGGVARFVTLCNEYRLGEQFRHQPQLITLFSGDAFNPSLESSVTKGETPSSLHPRHSYLIFHRFSYGTDTKSYWHGLCLCRGRYFILSSLIEGPDERRRITTSTSASNNSPPLRQNATSHG
jgi:hypothetical protein